MTPAEKREREALIREGARRQAIALLYEAQMNSAPAQRALAELQEEIEDRERI